MTNNLKITKEIDNHEKMQRKILFIKSVALLLSILIALLGATVAWFASNTSANGMIVTTKKPMVTNFTLGDDEQYTQSIELPCAFKLSDYEAADISLVNQMIYIANYRMNKTSGASSSTVYIKFFFPEDVEYIKVMYLGATTAAGTPKKLTTNNLSDWKSYLANPNSLSDAQKQTKGFCATEDSGQKMTIAALRNTYFAFYADYDAPYIKDGNGNTVKTLGQALKDGDIQQSDLRFDFDIRVKDANPFGPGD